MFEENWTRYVFKLATGVGKTKVLSLLIAWSYFHKLYEKDSDLSTNFLLIAPNIIVLERLKEDFNSLKIFSADPVIPENGFEGKNWKNDFNVTLHIQDEIGTVSPIGNIFLTNIHRIFEGKQAPANTDENMTDFFLCHDALLRPLPN
jgi:type III restriction enzyme